jgi:hypothetical protein
LTTKSYKETVKQVDRGLEGRQKNTQKGRYDNGVMMKRMKENRKHKMKDKEQV